MMTQAQTLEILKTGANVFLSGDPGAGKTHTIREYVRYLRDSGMEPAITASTGIAATHIGGMTIHSWSGIGIKNYLDKYSLDPIASTEHVVKRVRKNNVLIIDAGCFCRVFFSTPAHHQYTERRRGKYYPASSG